MLAPIFGTGFIIPVRMVYIFRRKNLRKNTNSYVKETFLSQEEIRSGLLDQFGIREENKY
jgi:hypothetical protein